MDFLGLTHSSYGYKYPLCSLHHLEGKQSLTGMTILRPTDEDNISDEGIIRDEVIRSNEESHHH